MMIAAVTKLCRTCGQVKPRTEFYVNERRPSGRHKLMSRCKACARKDRANRKRKSEGEYRTLEQVRVARFLQTPLPVLCEEEIERDQWKKQGLWDWAAALQREYQCLKDRTKQRVSRVGWKKWADNAACCLRIRVKHARKSPRVRPRRKAHDTIAEWMPALIAARRRLIERAEWAVTDQWTKTMRTKARNLRMRAGLG